MEVERSNASVVTSARCFHWVAKIPKLGSEILTAPVMSRSTASDVDYHHPMTSVLDLLLFCLCKHIITL